MSRWLSKDPDAYLPDRPEPSRPYLERAREHALRHDGPPRPQDWKLLHAPWLIGGALWAIWAGLAYTAALIAGIRAVPDTLIVALPLLLLARVEALHWGGAALHERRDRPSWLGHPLGGAPWLAIAAVHLAVVTAVVGITALLSADEPVQRGAVLASGLVALAAGWLLDLAWGRAERRTHGLPAISWAWRAD